MDGLRLLVIRGVPSPWTQAAKGIFKVKGLAHQLVQRGEDDPPALLREWTGQDSFPVVAYEAEPTRSGWAEILLLAERLAPSPSLIPSDPTERVLFFGLCHEIAGEMGLAWCRRIMGIDAGLKSDPPNPASGYLGPKYGYNEDSAARAPGRIVDILTVLRDQLLGQQDAGNRYLMGELSALDIYWATFCTLLSPPPPEVCPIPDYLVDMFTATEPEVVSLLAGPLLGHRDFIYDEHLGLPVEM